MRRTALSFVLVVALVGHIRRNRRRHTCPGPGGKVKVDSVFQDLNKLQKHRQHQQGQFVPTESPGFDASVDYVAKLLKDKGFDIQTGAHLDRFASSPGINHNGNGVAAVLEMALQLGS
jgi:hypothetical protein